MLSSFRSKIFQRWSHVHSICCSRENFWVTSDTVVDNGNNIVFWMIDLLLVKLKWWEILSLTWLLCAISKEKMNLWVTCDHLVFKGFNLKWRNTRSIYNIIVLHRMRFSLNSGMCVGISFGSNDSSDFRLLALLKGKDRRRLLYLPVNDFATKILKSSEEIELPSFVTQCDYTQWQCRWDQKTSSNKIWTCFYDLVDMQPFFDR